MITKRTDELRSGDVVVIFGHRFSISSVTPTSLEGLLRVRYEPDGSDFTGGCAESASEWQVDEPSSLDLAVQRAQELADQWFNNEGVTGKEITELLALFRAAR